LKQVKQKLNCKNVDAISNWPFLKTAKIDVSAED
jgi:hypothetical protein